MIVHLGADHRGYQKKEKIKIFLRNLSYEVVDHGADSYDAQDHYPIFAFKVAEAVSQKKSSTGLLICGSGIGMAVAANKVKGVLASHVSSIELARRAKKHNYLNILSLGADILSMAEMKEIIEVFLSTKKDGAKRHFQRVKQIKEYENLSNNTN